MDFELGADQRALRDATRGLLEAKSPISEVRRIAETGAEFDPALWRAGTDMGWPALAIAEDLGGLGQRVTDLAIVAVELGRTLAPSPFLPTAVVAEALADAGRADPLGAVLAGTAEVSWAFEEPDGDWSIDSLTTAARTEGDGYVLTGRKTCVQDAAAAHWLLVDARQQGTPVRFLVPADAIGVGRTRQRTLDITRALSDITLDEVPLPAEALLAHGPAARRSMRNSMRLATVLACAELVGVGERLLELTVEYARTRQQFGRAIGSFQAVKHKCADMRLGVQASTAATYHAAMAVADGAADADRAVSVAKAYASQAICRLAGEALQVHGGIGFTWEHDLHMYLRRARSNALLFGTVTHHREMLCRSLEAGEPAAS